MGPTAAQALEFLLLQDPQQLRLQGKGNIPYFIQEQCPSIGHFETANFQSHSSGEGALLVPEEFAFQQVKGNGGAIQLDKRACAAWADVVNGPYLSLRVRARWNRSVPLDPPPRVRIPARGCRL